MSQESDIRDGASFDLVVIGAGPAGEKAAAQAAYFGKRVAVIEASAVGGAVVNTGTLPSKTLRETALYLSGLRSRNLYGIEYSFARDISVDDLFFRQKSVEQTHLELVRENLARHGVALLAGRGELLDAHTVAVHRDDGDVRVRGDFILVATGTHPARPEHVPFDDDRVFDSDTILRLTRIPSSLLIVGGGVIGCEYATIFGALGVRVTLIDGGKRLLPAIDEELAGILAHHMRTMGVTLHLDCHVRSIERGSAAVSVTTDDDATVKVDAVLYCGGRGGNTHALGLERLGIAVDERGRIGVDEHYRTSAPSVLAAGDVIGFPALAATSMEQGRVAVCHAFGFAYKREVSSLVPYGLYTIPEISMVGASEQALQKAGTPYLVGRGRFERNARAQIAGDTEGLIKLIFDPATKSLLGVEIIGDKATELIHIGQMCMQFGGTIDAFIDNVFNFPTIAEAYKYAAYDGLQAIQRSLAGGRARVLFLCTGNSARSLIAEALLRASGGDRFDVHSAGVEPKGVNPHTLRALEAAGVSADGLRSKDIRTYEAAHFDYVITLCDDAAEHCPTFAGAARRLHWSLADPAAVTGSDAQRQATFDATLAGLRTRIDEFVAMAAAAS